MRKIGNKQQNGCPKFRTGGNHVVQPSIFTNSHVNGYQSFNQKTHKSDAIDAPPVHVSIKERKQLLIVHGYIMQSNSVMR
jgi:hypothetical protein